MKKIIEAMVEILIPGRAAKYQKKTTGAIMQKFLGVLDELKAHQENQAEELREKQAEIRELQNEAEKIETEVKLAEAQITQIKSVFTPQP